MCVNVDGVNVSAVGQNSHLHQKDGIVEYVYVKIPSVHYEMSEDNWTFLMCFGRGHGFIQWNMDFVQDYSLCGR